MPFPPIFPPPCGGMETERGRKPPPPRPGPPPIPPMCYSRETMIVYSLVCSSWTMNHGWKFFEVKRLSVSFVWNDDVINMIHKITSKIVATAPPPPPTHPGPPPIPPCTECPVGCENGNEPEPGTVFIKTFQSFKWIDIFGRSKFSVNR